MNALSRSLVLVATLLACTLTASDADARKRRHHDNSWHDRAENRRDARRTAIVVGAVASGVTRSSAGNRADRHYQDCMQSVAYAGYDSRYPNAYGYGPDYQWCAQMRYQEEQRGRRAGQRAGAVAGSIAYDAVRD